ncbi:hypothetical protein [Nocardioides montaniterrae]
MTDVVIHIGMGKTGTSSLQEWFGRNRPVLADHGVLYPTTPGRFRHVKLGLMTTPVDELNEMPAWRRMNRDDPERYQAEMRAATISEIRDAALPRVLLSNEGHFGSSEAAIAELGGFLGSFASSVRVVVYLRRQDDHLLSRYQQLVKVGSTERLASRVDVDLSDLYDYAARLTTWQRVLAPDALVVRPFEREQLAGGSLQQDFLDTAGIDLREDALAPVPRTNESLDAEAVELLRLLNLFRVEQRGATAGQIDNRDLITRLAGRPGTGPTLGLPADLLDPFLARWADSNAEVARTWLGREDGTLFRSSQRSTNVVTEQGLDPRRLPRLLKVAGVARADRAGVRRLAEREARSAK